MKTADVAAPQKGDPGHLPPVAPANARHGNISGITALCLTI